MLGPWPAPERPVEILPAELGQPIRFLFGCLDGQVVRESAQRDCPVGQTPVVILTPEHYEVLYRWRIGAAEAREKASAVLQDYVRRVEELLERINKAASGE